MWRAQALINKGYHLTTDTSVSPRDEWSNEYYLTRLFVSSVIGFEEPLFGLWSKVWVQWWSMFSKQRSMSILKSRCRVVSRILDSNSIL
jgi:hypothetical protein